MRDLHESRSVEMSRSEGKGSGAGRLIAGTAAAVVLAGAVRAAVTWSRYGRVDLGKDRDELLDRFMPTCEAREYHETRVAAPAEITFAVARRLELARSPLVRWIFRGRELLMGSSRTAAKPPRPSLEEVLELGWRILAEEPGREIVLGAVTQPWQADVVFRGVAPEEFAAFDEPGYVRIAWTMAVRPEGADRSVFRTETRVSATDAVARARFRRYWVMVEPGVRLIRMEILRMVRREAERAQAGA